MVGEIYHDPLRGAGLGPRVRGRYYILWSRLSWVDERV